MKTVVMDKHRSTWYWTVENEQGGSFGSNYCGPMKGALWHAMHCIPSGEDFRLIVNGKEKPRQKVTL